MSMMDLSVGWVVSMAIRCQLLELPPRLVFRILHFVNGSGPP
jgi:hypothetical protein